MSLKVESGRASARSGVRTIIVFSSVLWQYLHWSLTPIWRHLGLQSGQLALLVVGVFEGAGITLMVRLVREPTSVETSPRN